ncbi:hypothetical protein DERP_006035 [Dermatophagoides pteronyssinus]|uniref:Uncharacterized protein n=1 Tax=Dermatophagoides pteronyssinus TaxID=6956 RepID=A0ABQ8JT30_DERPT|nr:hypothetical protein DERP_006035 [Dermatophagoides pteronyssinus]
MEHLPQPMPIFLFWMVLQKHRKTIKKKKFSNVSITNDNNVNGMKLKIKKFPTDFAICIF